MKTIKIEMQENVYDIFLNFLELLPKKDFKVYEATELSQEQAQVRKYNKMIDKGDFSEFIDYEDMKNGIHT